MRFFWLHRTAVAFLVAVTGLGLTLLPGSMTARAQGIITGSITGSVVDQTGAVIPGASVTAVSESTGTTLQGISNGQGIFQIVDVPLGSYTITISASGFGPSKVSHVQVVAGNATSIGSRSLKLGSAAQTVEVEGDAAQLINTESAQVETTIDSQQVASAPVTGAMDNLTMMVPGVVNTHSDGMSNTNGANFSVNGQRGRSNNSEIDGQTNNDTSIGGPSFFFDNQDAIQEVQVLTSDMGAQYGRNMGAIVNYITKSGTNSFHGSGFEIYTGSWLSSLMQYQKDPNFGGCAGSPGCKIQAPKFVQNNWGGTLGGPILKDKLFFFGSTLWDHTYEGGVVLTSGGALFPDPAGLATLQSAFPNNPGVAAMTLNGPYSSKLGNPTPLASSATTVPVTDGNTTANVEVAGYERTFPNQIFDQEHLGRIDYQLTPKDRFYLRYNYQNNPYFPAFYLVSAATAAGGGYPNVNGISHEVGGDWTHTFSPTIVNQLRYAFQQSNIAFEAGAIPTCTIANFGTCTSTITLGAPFSTYGYGAGLPQGRFVKVNQVQDNASWNKGRHTIMFGGEFDYQDSPWGFLPNASGAFNFTPGASSYPLRNTSSNPALANGLTAMLEGVAEVSLAQGSATIPFKESDFALYFQDNWKVTQNLTLNLGLRYEYFGQSVNQLHSESVKQQTGSNPFWSTSLPLSATTVPSVNSDLRNIEPRIGLAYSPSYLPKMVVHAGYSINVDPEFYNLFINMATAAPVVDSGNFGCDGVTIQCLPSSGLTFSTVQTADDKFLPIGGDPRIYPTQTVPTNFRNPMGETYTLGFQYQVAPTAVASVSYVGNHTFGQFQALNTNPDILDVQSAFPSYGSGVTVCTDPTAPGYTRPNCNNGLIETYGNTAFQIYNALQTSLTVRNFHGWTGTASYTYSREIDNVSEFASSGSGGTTNAFAQNPLNTDEAERGVAGNSYPHIWGIQMTYTEPWFAHQGGILGHLLGGYFMNAFYQFNGGQPFNPIQNSFSVVSTPVLADIAGSTGNPGNISAGTAAGINQTQAEYSFCDVGFAQQFGNPCRPILSNPKAPMNSIGINLGPGGYVDYVSGAPTTASAEHWLWNNQYEAISRNNPFPGVGRNILRGDSFNDLDLSVGKNIHLTERITMNLQVSAFNIMNRAYYGTLDPNVEDSAFGGFLSDQFAFGTGLGSAAGGGSFPQGLGNRNVQLMGKITF
jgi:hypothetical protein